MGILVGGAFVACAALARLVGMVLLAIHAVLARRGRGSWGAFSIASLAVAVGCSLYALYLWVQAPSHPGSPSGDDYGRWLVMACALGAACGFGLTGMEARRKVSA